MAQIWTVGALRHVIPNLMLQGDKREPDTITEDDISVFYE